MQDLVYVIDESGTLIYLNQEGLRRLKGADELDQTNSVFTIHDLEVGSNAERWSNLFKQLAETQEVTYCALHKRLDQIEYSVETHLKYICADDVSYIINISKDLSQRIQTEDARAQTAELESALQAVEIANQELEVASKAKDDFLASMSHELRTPLNSILGLSEALLESIYGELNREQARNIKYIEQSGHHLLALISDILDISKIRAGGMKLNLSDVDVESMCSEAIQHFKPEMRRKHLSFSFSIEGNVYTLRADERWFQQMLMNLLSNAVKFTPSGKSLGLKVIGDIERGSLRVTIWDEGIGIKEQDIPKLFQSFVQLDTSLARAYSGTGLGLSIVSSVMDLHKGEISVESVFGEGSQFHLDFPWSPVKMISQVELTPPPINLNSVLLIEDSVIDAEKVKRYFSEMDVEVYWDSTGGISLDEIKQINPDMILLDLNLPESSGWEILQKIKSDSLIANVPVIVCSVLEQDDQREEIDLLHDYLVKPLSRRALRRALRTVDQSNTKVQRALVVQPNENLSNKKILIVDDNQSNIQLVHDYLKRKGYHIVTAEDGYQAVQVTRALRPDLILMDVQMPHMDGIEATGHIKGDPNLKETPIFALTALAMPGDRERCLDAGMDDYFTKPVSLRVLYKKIKKTLGA